LLFLACYFPPAVTIACVRTWNVAKYLTKLGWDITVVTPHPSLWRRVENLEETETLLEREGIQRILTGCQWRCLSPELKSRDQGLGRLIGGVCRVAARFLDLDREIGWINSAEQACSALTAQDVDLVLATGSPFATFGLAKRLSDKLGCPYVLDYRDLWTGHLHPRSALPNRQSTIKEEARLLADCASATIVSHSWRSDLESRFGHGSKLHVVTNGYDPERLEKVEPNHFGHFAIVYTGTFYPPIRTISPIMAALQQLKKMTDGKSHEWYFHYYGPYEHHVYTEATKYEVIDQVILHGRVPRSEALSAVRAANVAVVITSLAEEGTLADKGMVTGKVFESLGLGTPILSVAPSDSDVRTIVESTGSGRSFTARDIDGMASFLTDLMNGRITKPNVSQVYAWTNIAKKMDCILRLAIQS